MILRLLSKLPEERPDSAEMLVAELAAIALGQRSSTSTVAPRVSGGQVATASTTVSTGRELAIVRPRPPAIQRRGVRTLVIGTAVGLCVVLFYIIMWFAM